MPSRLYAETGMLLRKREFRESKLLERPARLFGNQRILERRQALQRLAKFFQAAVAHRDRDIAQKARVLGALDGAVTKARSEVVFAS